MKITEGLTAAGYTSEHGALGRWSSHPRWLGWNARLFRWLAAIPLALFFAAGIWFATDLENWLPILRNAGNPAIAAVAIACFFLAALMSISLCQRVGEIQESRSAQTESRAEHLEIHWLVIAVAGAAVVLLPILLLRVPGLPLKARSLVWLGSVLPLGCILIALRIIGDPPKPGAQPKRRWWLAALFVLSAACTVAAWVHDFAFFERYRLLGLLILPSITAILFTLWRLWPRWEVPAPAKVEAPKDENVGPPEWLKSLQAPPGCTWGEPKLIEDTSFAPAAKSPSPFFLPHVPTEDQAAALKRFISAQREMHESLATKASPDEFLRGDVILHGEPGSGRTTTLMAMALTAFLMRGQRVLWLVPEDLRKSGVQKRLSSLVARLHLSGLAPLGELNQNVARALGNESVQLPSIVVATLSDWEGFCSTEIQSHAGFDRLLRAILSFDTVLVDDVDDFPDAARLHLPFSLDRHRLLLEAYAQPVQLVATFPTLSKAGGMIAGDRLSGRIGLNPQNDVLFLRPPKGSPAWRVDVQAADPRKGLEQLAVACLQKNLRVVVYRKGLDDGERKALQNHLLIQGGAEGGLQVIADLDQAAAASAEKNDTDWQSMNAVLYHATLHEDACLALRLNFGDLGTVLFCFTGAGADLRRERVECIPVLTNRSAAPLVCAHALNVLRFLKTNVPIAMRPWAQLGLDFDKAAERGNVGYADECWLVLDQLPADSEKALRDHVWNYATLDRPPLRIHALDINAVPDESQRFARVPHHPIFAVAREETEQSRAEILRRAYWTAPAQGGPLLQTDLAAALRLRLSFQDRVFVPEQIIERESGTEIVAQLWLGGGMDFYVPEWRFEWELRDEPAHATDPEDLAARALFAGGRDSGLLLFEMDLKLKGVARVSTQLSQLLNEQGAEQPINAIDFQFPATYSCMLLEPSNFDTKNLAEVLGAVLKGTWKTSSDSGFLPGLTSALNYAFNAHTRGLSAHARILAFKFRGTDESALKASAVVWFIEPVFTGRTPMPLLTQVFREPEQQRSIFASVVWALERIKASPSPLREMRRLAEGGFGDGAGASDVDESLSLIQRLTNPAGR